MTQQPVEPILYDLAGDGIQITYTPATANSQAALRYQDSSITRTYTGDEITIEKSRPSTLLSVMVEFIPNGGPVFLTLLLPGVNMAGQEQQPIETLAIRTQSRKLFGTFPPGAMELYRVYHLAGMARLSTTTDPVTLSLDAASYLIGNPISVTLSNQSSQTIQFPDQQSECSVILLQHQENGNWQAVNPCVTGIPFITNTLEAGQRLTVKLVSSSRSAGNHRAALTYTPSEASALRTVYSQEFRVVQDPK